ncbi:tetratricopeptide repeat protein [Azospirillum sp. ST 5-10]|uniref:tetratricopeptide repeat protein n=1 Tax=unclassified Azospirillum TaxID=2630922 RepID=UPI003F49B639
MSANPAPETIAAAVRAAVRLAREGAAGEAERLLRGVLAADGTVGEAWLRLGGLALGDGRPRVAARCFARLMLLEPERAAALHNLGEALRLAGRPQQAGVAFGRALRLRPDHAKATAALAILHKAAGRKGAAARGLARAAALDPGLPAAWHALGMLAHGRNRADAACRMMRRAALLAPRDPAMQAALGFALCEEGRHAAAASGLRRALALAPADPAHWGGLAGVSTRLGDADGALALTRRIRRIDPAASEADATDSQLWLLHGDLGRADALARRALALAPDRPTNLINAGLMAHSLRRLREARAWGGRALRVDPASDVARFNLSMTLLALGDFARGWPLYEARWRMAGAAFPDHAPAWDGSPLAGRTILLTAEQGHGDTLHFARYAPLLAAMGGRVALHVQPGLKRLLARMPGVATVTGFGEPPPSADLCAPLMSVPGLVGTRLDSVPAAPYLRAVAADRPKWRDRLAGEERLKVGLVWAGEPRPDDFKANAVDRRRSLPLAALAPLAAVPGVAFYSLQKGEAARQMPPAGLRLTDWMDEVGDFADTAALVEQLDLVITVDTSMCHLAGGLGRPVWVLSRFDACWRWLDNREDSPWYPTMRLFHQAAPGDWGPVVDRVAAELRLL